jgi:hypothetical protein
VHPLPTPDWVAVVERSAREEQWAILSLLAGRRVELDPDELNGAIRRAELLLASAGDPRRAPELQGRAVSAVAADLDAPEHRVALQSGLKRLAPAVEGYAQVEDALRDLLEDDNLAWQAYALGLLAEALANANDV